uniref:ATP synthase complex subunit 8 n=3 Tax=Empoascini TaxID=562036 RepID=A0A077D9K1_EMPVT|nr:ATP synthase F0 subunit 8 [Empoasca vitis]YP_009469869.1 ATP synthase F0 subunit 8 [Matsumurasca onukii]QFO89466.1 ATP synthase F0 subunit 8 [Empoasca flavescens]AIL29201.1 ATP synthase F0 subunit 8 [Empoasca vitis]AVF91592.1 ATP synthase F0 subunit 8 [Matsumurasca onukii]UGK73337.1 ATP synthase F0 subunit 8 [Empoasca vitis]
MPQMAPVWWLSLMLFFIIIFFISMCYVYFNLSYSINYIKSTKKSIFIWSW